MVSKKITVIVAFSLAIITYLMHSWNIGNLVYNRFIGPFSYREIGLAGLVLCYGVPLVLLWIAPKNKDSLRWPIAEFLGLIIGIGFGYGLNSLHSWLFGGGPAGWPGDLLYTGGLFLIYATPIVIYSFALRKSFVAWRNRSWSRGLVSGCVTLIAGVLVYIFTLFYYALPGI